jgi:hypothetical protein
VHFSRDFHSSAYNIYEETTVEVGGIRIEIDGKIDTNLTF